MKTVLLLRHAKSDRAAGTDDKERPLNERGKIAAPKMGQLMQERGLVPDLALVSSAERTRQTWALLETGLHSGVEAEFRDALYLAPAARLIDTLRGLEDTCQAALLVGHNPGTEEAVARLAAAKQAGPARGWLAAIKEKYPTCALAVLRFETDAWSKLKTGTGELAAFLTPAMIAKDLDD